MIQKIGIPFNSFSMESKWRCKLNESTRDSYTFDSGPTTDEHTVQITYSIPSGAEIKVSQIWAKFGTPFTGISENTVNGEKFRMSWQDELGANVTLQDNSGVLTAVFYFKANGNLEDAKENVSTLDVLNPYLWIEYEFPDNGSVIGAEAQTQERFDVPPQSCCIYDQDTGKTYLFDGVMSVQHALSMKIEEEPSKYKDQYVNNARNEPDKVTLSVAMSDVYSGGGDIIDASGWDSDSQKTAFYNTKDKLLSRIGGSESWSRSELAFYTLHRLKEDRKKLALITPQFVYVDMIIANLTVTWDEKCTYGWNGQLVLQKAYEQKKKKEELKVTSGDPFVASSAEILKKLSGLFQISLTKGIEHQTSSGG